MAFGIVNVPLHNDSTTSRGTRCEDKGAKLGEARGTLFSDLNSDSWTVDISKGVAAHHDLSPSFADNVNTRWDLQRRRDDVDTGVEVDDLAAGVLVEHGLERLGVVRLQRSHSASCTPRQE